MIYQKKTNFVNFDHLEYLEALNFLVVVDDVAVLYHLIQKVHEFFRIFLHHSHIQLFLDLFLREAYIEGQFKIFFRFLYTLLGFNNF